MSGEPPGAEPGRQDPVGRRCRAAYLVIRPCRQHVLPDEGQHASGGDLVQLDLVAAAQQAHQRLGVEPALAVGHVEHADQADGQQVHQGPAAALIAASPSTASCAM